MKVYLSLGSNIGDRMKYLEDAKTELTSDTSIQILKASSIYQTEHWPKEKNNKLSSGNNPNPHLNQVILAETLMKPEQLLSLLKKIEHKMGRRKIKQWGPREIDIDILLYGDEMIDLDQLKIPHPHMNVRQFVLVPLLEIEPDLKDPVSKQPYSDILKELKKTDSHSISKYMDF